MNTHIHTKDYDEIINIYKHTGDYIENMDMINFIMYTKYKKEGAVPVLRVFNSQILLKEKKGALLDITGTRKQNVSAFGLVTCASLILLSTDSQNNKKKAFVYHALSGNIDTLDFKYILNKLKIENDYCIYAVYVHPRDSDDNYKNAINTLIHKGIPSENILEIENFKGSCFGINSIGEIG